MAENRTFRRPGLIVYLSGVGTSFLALWLVEVINNHGENIMGWYANGIIPAGALLVGIASGVGYAIAARVLNVKLSKAFVLGMITTGLIDYVAAQWVTYVNILERMNIPSGRYSFGAYIRDICENMSFRRSGSQEAGTELGVLGYFFKALEMAGFALGSMIPCAVLRGLPYCGGCQRYLKKYQSVSLYSPVTKAEIKALPRPERAAAVAKATNDVNTRALTLLQQVAPLPLEATLTTLRSARTEKVEKSTAWVDLRLSKCPQCEAHHIAGELHAITEKGKPAQAQLPTLDKTNGPIASAPEASAPA